MKKNILLLLLVVSSQSARGMMVSVASADPFTTLSSIIEYEWVNLPEEKKTNPVEEQKRLNRIRLYAARAAREAGLEALHTLTNDPKRTSQAQGAEGAEVEFLLASAFNRFKDPKLFGVLLEVGADVDADNGFESFAVQVADEEEFNKQVQLHKVREVIADVILQVQYGLSPKDAVFKLKELVDSKKLDQELVFEVIEHEALRTGKQADAFNNLADALHADAMAVEYVEKDAKTRLAELLGKVKEFEKQQADRVARELTTQHVEPVEPKGIALSIPKVLGVAVVTGAICYFLGKLTADSSSN